MEKNEECVEHHVLVVNQRPTESCSVQAVPRCNVVTEEVPKIVPQLKCEDVPREVCKEMRKPKRVLVPKTRKDCRRPSILLSVLP